MWTLLIGVGIGTVVAVVLMAAAEALLDLETARECLRLWEGI